MNYMKNTIICTLLGIGIINSPLNASQSVVSRALSHAVVSTANTLVSAATQTSALARLGAIVTSPFITSSIAWAGSIVIGIAAGVAAKKPIENLSLDDTSKKVSTVSAMVIPGFISFHILQNIKPICMFIANTLVSAGRFTYNNPTTAIIVAAVIVGTIHHLLHHKQKPARHMMPPPAALPEYPTHAQIATGAHLRNEDES